VTPRSECALFTLDVVTTTTRPEQGGTRRGRRGNRGYLVAAVILIAVAITAVLIGAHTDPSKVSGPVDTSHLDVGPVAPAVDASAWINSPPLTQADLRGKVVLYDFWTYSCVNCVRTFPDLRAWFDRYTPDGLVVIGIHSPEFDFEKVQKNVEDAVKRDAVTWPVALDSDMAIWKKFQNQYWPADYVADRKGHIRYKHFGEGDYTNTENVIRKLLGVKPTSPRAGKVTHSVRASEVSNPETYLGLQYQTAQPLIEVQPGSRDYPEPAPASIAPPRVSGGVITLVPGKTEGALVGKWSAGPEAVTSDAAAATILIGVHAKEVNLVMASKSGEPIDAVIQLDGQPVAAADRGSSVHMDDNGRTIVTVKASDMYRLLQTSTIADHVLSISATGPGLEAYAFTFG
jgi:thiol-disulfide isomerase/thioredoxin